MEEDSLKEAEEVRKKELFDSVLETAAKVRQLAELTKKNGFIKDTSELPNIAITLNNKLVEVNNQFEEAGTSMFAVEDDDFDFIDTPFVGDAVVEHLIGLINEAMDEVENLKNVTTRALERVGRLNEGLKSTSVLRRIFTLLKIYIRRENLPGNMLTRSEYEKSQIYLEKFRSIDKKIQDFDLKDRVVDCVILKLKDESFFALMVSGILKDSMIPDLYKLGGKDTVSKFKQELMKALEEYYSKEKEELLVEKDEIDSYVYEFDPEQIEKENGGPDEPE